MTGKKLNRKKTTKAILDKVEEGLSDYQIYTALAVSSSTFHLWKQEHQQEYTDAKDQFAINSLELVERKLNKKIYGGWRRKERYEIDESGKEVLVSVERQQVDPELNAIMFFLKNRAPEKWNLIEITKIKQEDNANENLRKIVQDLSKYDVKNYEPEEDEYPIPKEFDSEE